MCFNLRALDDEKKAKMGINECVNHGLITPFPVLVIFVCQMKIFKTYLLNFLSLSFFQFEKEDEVVAQFKFTTLLMPNGPMRITGLPFDPNNFESDHKIEDEEIKVRLL